MAVESASAFSGEIDEIASRHGTGLLPDMQAENQTCESRISTVVNFSASGFQLDQWFDLVWNTASPSASLVEVPIRQL
jgi:hypothetical protein